MKIIVASFQCESNSRAGLHPAKGDFEYFSGEDIFKKMPVKDYFEESGFRVIPSIYANALPSGTVQRDIYDYYVNQILDTVRENPDTDGIFLYVHGSMEVEGIGSGELFLLRAIREIVSEKCVTALTMDLHANVPEDFGSFADIVCAYKTAPHVDQTETQMRAARALVRCLKSGIRPKTYVRKIPMLVKGDTMLTAYPPLSELEAETVRMEREEGVFGVNMFFGHCWVDAENTSASAVVSAATAEQAEKSARYIAGRLWDTRRDYKFLIETEPPEECVKRAVRGREKRIFITDSGDNTTAGAEGDRTDILKMLIKSAPAKKACVAGITAPNIVDRFFNIKTGEEVAIDGLGKGELTGRGEILGWAKEIIGRSLTVSFGNVDAVFTEKRSAFIEKGNFDKANVPLEAYEIVVVKLGYLFEELKPYADRELFALSDGASCVELSALGLKNIKRPMFPLDDFEWKAYTDHN